MADDHELQVQIGSVLDPLIERFGREAVREAVEAALSNPPGRPRGWAIDDWPALENMHLLISSGKATTPTDAARRSLLLAENHNDESTVRRLRDKYREVEPELEKRAADREVRLAVQAFEAIYRDLVDARQTWLESGKREVEAVNTTLAEIAKKTTEDLHAALTLNMPRLTAEEFLRIFSSGGKPVELISGDEPEELSSGDKSPKNKSS